jgi:hypothetical protein
MNLPLLLLNPMAQLGHGATQVMEAHMPLVTKKFAISVAIHCITSNSDDAMWICAGLCSRFFKR